MGSSKYLLLYRTPAESTSHQPSPTKIQKMMVQWQAWKDRFTAEVLDLGDGLRPDGRVLRSGAVSDGPYIEAKDVMGGYSIIQAETTECARSRASLSNPVPAGCQLRAS